MVNMLRKDSAEMLLLSLIAQRNGECNWHTLGRRVLNDLQDPAEFDRAFKVLRDELRLIQEVEVDGENLPILRLTDEGVSALNQ
jgi:hypothetical protein